MKKADAAKKSKDGKYRVSQSKMGTWLRCRLAYWYKYVLKLRARHKSRPLQFGTMVHEMAEAAANDLDPFDKLEEFEEKQGKLFRQQIEEYGNIVEDVGYIMEAYFNFHGKDSLVYATKKGQNAEHVFEVEIAPDIILTGKIDAIVKTPNKLRWLLEHKSFSRLPNEDHRWRNLQSAIYLRVIDMLGWAPVDGVAWDYIWSRPPSVPEFLKSGQLSRRAIQTLPSRLDAFFKEHKLKAKDFPELVAGAERSQKDWFPRIFTPVKKKVVDILWSEAVETAIEMRDMHGQRKARHIGRHCEWCEFEPLCRAELQSLDTKHIMEREFYVPEKEEHDGPIHTD